MTGIIRLADRLTAIRRLDFTSHSGDGSHCGWSGHGQGEVTVSHAIDALRFHERGHFRSTQGERTVPFRNVYRWECHADHVRLFHERRGETHAVWLFDLVADPASDDLVEACAHLCGADRYSARLTFASEGFDLHWRITGPRKDERLHYRYRPS